MKKLIVCRGSIDAGKSEKAREIANLHEGAVILSADDFFMSDDGKYQFDERLIESAHVWNRNRCAKSMKQGKDLIVIDNLNLKKREYQEYLDLAELNKYESFQVICSGSAGLQEDFLTPHWDD